MQPKTELAPFRIYVVYKNPRDFPGRYVVRGMSVTAEEKRPDAWPLRVSADLEEVRAAIPGGRTRLDRDKNDDPAIFEVWI